MQSRWFDFGGDTIVRADKYAPLLCEATYADFDRTSQIHTAGLRPAIPKRMDLLQSPVDGNELGGLLPSSQRFKMSIAKYFFNIDSVRV